ncbi:MAG: glycosyltransferase family 4 protein [Candidatus Magasanikbacteria bacterium]|nr:glycosyltransferase family 4 protein [Candidatus Magasanikbacteria bacterium]
MNIGVDIRCLMDPQRTGVGEYTFGLLDAVFKIDRENQYFLFYNSYQDISGILPRWDYQNVHYVSTKWPNIFLNFFLLLGFVKLDNLVIKKLFENCKLPSSRAHFVVTQWNQAEGKIENLEAWFSPNLNFTPLTSKTKFILTVHDLSFEFLPECYTAKQRLWHKLLRPKKQCERADLILTPSESTARDVVSAYDVDEKKVKVLYPGISALITQNTINKTQVRKKYNLPENFILFLGTIEPRKNVEAVVVAFQNTYTLTHLHTYTLVIAGARGWKNENVMRAIKEMPNVRYINYVAEEDKPALYRLASLFVYSSLYEGFGLPVLEAMACGTPVITSNRSSLPEVGGDAVCYVNPANVAELSRAMVRVLRDDELGIKNYELRIDRQREQVKKFDWGETAKEFLSVIKI